jgi:hypothetical protein
LTRIYDSLGTLGDEGQAITCSLDTATRWARSRTIVPYPSFETAAQDVRQGLLSVVLVPAAYPELHRLIMDASLRAEEVFLSKLPPLIVAGRDARPPAKAAVLFHHPATQVLLREVEINFERSQFSSSNAQACVDVLSSEAPAIAITNQLCADFHRLSRYRVLRKSIIMPFICFTREGAP